MASWSTEAAASSFNANTVITDMTTQRQRDTASGGSFLGSVSDFLGGITGGGKYSIVGINGNEISTMENAITNYVTNAQTMLEKALQNIEETLKSGFRGGDAEAAVKAYLEKVKEYVKNLVDSLNSFKDKLRDVGNAWVKAQQEFGTSVNNAAGSYGTGTAYTESVQYSGPSA